MGVATGTTLIGLLVVVAALLLVGGAAWAWGGGSPARVAVGTAAATAGVAVAVVVALIAAALAAAWTIFPGRAVPSASERWNVALLGVDSRVGHLGEPVHVDSIAVLSVSRSGAQTVLFTVPRDVEQVPLPLDSPLRAQWTDGVADCGAACQLSSLYLSSYNEEAYAGLVPTGSTPALEAVRDGLRGILGVDIHAVVEVDAVALASAVNVLGGVAVEVERPVPMTAAPEVCDSTAWLQPGPRVLDGEEAAWFVRSRVGSSNAERMQRQAALLGALRAQTSVAELVLAAPALAAAVDGGFRTDMSPELALQAVLDIEDVRTVPLLDGLDPNDPDWRVVRERVVDATGG